MDIQAYMKRTRSTFAMARKAYKDAYNQLQTAEKALTQARKDCPSTGIHTLEARKKLYDAEIQYEEANAEWNNAKKAFERFDRDFTLIDKEFLAELQRETATNPDAIDDRAMMLLQSGIMSTSDYIEMARKFHDNRTMSRMIAKFAAERADKEENADDRIELRGIAIEGNKNDLLEKWNAFKNTVNNVSGKNRRTTEGLARTLPEAQIGLAEMFERFTGVYD